MCYKVFNNDLQHVPFDVAYLFDYVGDIFSAWEKLYTDALNDHAPLKTGKFRGASEKSRFITPEIKTQILQNEVKCRLRGLQMP